ncbi:MAG: FAD-binding oxidoreductase [Archaeoglobus sp.]|nr:FAD-binding oxidoreductase [Archaeoglobus sp.]
MKIAIIGSGIVGLSAAYNLANSAEVIVFERRYPLYGSSGRNSGGITPMLGSKELIELAKKSIRIYDSVQGEVNFNFLLRKDGYLKVAKNDADLDELEKEYHLQKSMGVKVREVDPYEIKNMVQGFNPKSVEGGFFGEGGVIFPWPVIWGYEKGCKERGVEIKPMTQVSEVVVEGGEVKGLKANGEFYKADFVVNAAGAWSNEISKLAGVELNNTIIKEEICVLESLKPFIDPYILNVSNGVYLSQSARGEVVGGILGKEVSNPETSSSLDFLIKYAKRAVEMIPSLKGLSVLRQWAGVYDSGKDGLPVIGETNVKGFIQANGLGKYGMTIGPAAGELVAEVILKGKTYDKFSPERF